MRSAHPPRIDMDERGRWTRPSQRPYSAAGRTGVSSCLPENRWEAAGERCTGERSAAQLPVTSTLPFQSALNELPTPRNRLRHKENEECRLWHVKWSAWCRCGPDRLRTLWYTSWPRACTTMSHSSAGSCGTLRLCLRVVMPISSLRGEKIII